MLANLLYSYGFPCEPFQDWKKRDNNEKHENTSLQIVPSLLSQIPALYDTRTIMKPTATEKKHEFLSRRNDTYYQPGMSPIEQLPVEILDYITKILVVDTPPKCFASRNKDLISLYLSSRKMKHVATSTLYRQIFIPRSHTFREFLSCITRSPMLGTIVQRLDFSHFNPTGAGMTARERTQMTNLTSETLFQCLQLTPNIREFLAQEHIDEDLDFQVIEKLFCHLPKLEALDFTACASSNFCKSLTMLAELNPSPLTATLPITRLCLHKCNLLPASVFSTILSRIPHLTHLDVSYTQITDSALRLIQNTALITHLNLSRCARLTGSSVVKFLTQHPAAKNLVYLNLAMDSFSEEKFDSGNIETLLPRLPRSLRSLNLKGSEMSPRHLPLLLPLTKHLEELGLGRHLGLKDIIYLLVPDDSLTVAKQISWIPHTLRYIDISDMDVDQLDLGTMFGMSCPLFQRITEPLEVLEINSAAQKRVFSSSIFLKRVGWCTKETGYRNSLERERIEDEGRNGRYWKWDVTRWGMRKIPIARAGEKGMYGYWMFKYAK